jgi:hypothetical protein
MASGATGRSFGTGGTCPLPTIPQTARCFRVDDWFRLPAATVEIRHHGTYVRTARVEAATPDSRMLWLCQEGVDSRVLIDKLDGYEVWIDPEQLYNVGQHR